MKEQLKKLKIIKLKGYKKDTRLKEAWFPG